MSNIFLTTEKKFLLSVINIHQGIKLEGRALWTWDCVFCFRRQPFVCVSILHVCVHALRELPLEWIIYRRVSFAYVQSTGHRHKKFRSCRHRSRPLSIVLPAACRPMWPICPLQMLLPTSLCMKPNKKSKKEEVKEDIKEPLIYIQCFKRLILKS